MGDQASESHVQELRAAFDEMLRRIAAGRDAIDQAALKPPPATGRNLAEGYRYLMGYVAAAVERSFAEDTAFPYFRRAMPLHNKSTWDNADNLYLAAAIDGDRQYRIRGRALDHGHWRGGPPVHGLRAPLYGIFTAVTHYTGDSGGLAELVPQVTNNAGSIDTAALEVAADGTFEILLGPDRPAGFDGNFLATRTMFDGAKQRARFIVCRELFGDWENERNLELDIVSLDHVGAPQPAHTAEDARERLERVGELVEHPMRFWNEYFATILNGYGDSAAPTPYAFPPPNATIAPSAPSATVGAAQATNIYAGGMYDLKREEALIIAQSTPVEPVYTGFNLCNIWGESYDYANYVSSLNNTQVRSDDDGCVRYVVSHEDPGVNNWLDTTGHEVGMLSQRWAYHEQPDELPTVEFQKVPVSEVSDHLPRETARVTPEERREQVRVRQGHVQRRFGN
jgi:hypothetical protein